MRERKIQRGDFTQTKNFSKETEKSFKKSDTVKGVLYRNNGKIDVRASIDFLSKNNQEESERSPIWKQAWAPAGRNSALGKDSEVTTKSLLRLGSYRSIQHEPSDKKQHDYVSKSNFSALKSQREQFSSKIWDSDRDRISNLTMKINKSGAFSQQTPIDVDMPVTNIMEEIPVELLNQIYSED